MFEYYRNKNEKFEDVLKMNQKITRMLIKDGILKLSDFDSYILPSSKENIIPSIEKIAFDAKLFTDSISRALSLESFLDIDKSYIDENTFFGSDFLIANDTYFTTNPLANYIEKLKINSGKFTEKELLFSKLGFISTKDLESFKESFDYNNVEVQKEIKLTSYLKIENRINEILYEGVEKEAKAIKLHYKNSKLIMGLLINNVHVERDLSIVSVEEYKEFINYISSIFENNILFKNFNGGRYKFKIMKSISTEESSIIELVSIKISNLNKAVDKLDNMGLSYEDEKLFNKKLGLPSGLLIVSSKNNLKSKLYSVMQSQTELKPFLKMYSIESYIEKSFDDIIQFEKGENSGNDLNLVDYPLIAVDKVNSPEEFNMILSAVSRGKFVILGVTSSGSIEAFSKILKMTDDANELSDNLVGLIHVDEVPKVCSYCSKKEIFIKTNNFIDFSILENSPKVKSFVKIENKSGCENCNGGYRDSLSVAEFLDNDKSLKTAILQNQDLGVLRIEKNSNSWNSIYEVSATYLKEGLTTENGIIKSIGMPKKNQ